MDEKETGRTVLGNLVAARRAELGLTQEEVSEKAGMSQEWCSMLERGRIVQPRISALMGLQKVLDIPVEELVVAAGYSRTRAGAAKLIPEEIEDPELAASFLSLQKLSRERLQQARTMIDVLARMDDDEFQAGGRRIRQQG